MKYPWGAFSAIEWDGKIYRTRQLVSICFCFCFSKCRCVYSYYSVLMPTHLFIQVKSQKTQPILYGTVIQFLLYGNYKGDVFATGGQVEVAMVRRELMTLMILSISLSCCLWILICGVEKNVFMSGLKSQESWSGIAFFGSVVRNTCDTWILVQPKKEPNNKFKSINNLNNNTQIHSTTPKMTKKALHFNSFNGHDVFLKV